MQKAAISSVLPILLEQIFEKFLNCSSVDQGKTENFLLDLHNLLGRRLVPAALHILDNQSIVIYTSNQNTIEIAEIFDPHSSSGLARLLRQINYCTCEYFKEEVLTKKDTYSAPYTCQHVLAVRLAIVLHHKCLHYKEIPFHSFNLLLTTLISTEVE